MDVVLLPYASSQTYARDYFNCKGMAASPVLRRKGILFTPDCLQGRAHINKGPQHFQKSGQACSGGQLACPPLSLGAGVTAVAEGETRPWLHVPSKSLSGALAATVKGSRLRSGFFQRSTLSLQLSERRRGLMSEGKHLPR